MAQTLHSQSIEVASMDVYRWRHGLEPLQSRLSSAKRRRNRGVILSDQGWQKLVEAGVLHDEFGNRYTYEQLSERSLLDGRTVSRLLSCEVKVDKRTLKTFFQAFDLVLEADDYALLKHEETGAVTSEISPYAALARQMVEFEQLVEELRQMRQRLKDYDQLLHRMGLNESHVRQHMGA